MSLKSLMKQTNDWQRTGLVTLQARKMSFLRVARKTIPQITGFQLLTLPSSKSQESWHLKFHYSCNTKQSKKKIGSTWHGSNSLTLIWRIRVENSTRELPVPFAMIQVKERVSALITNTWSVIEVLKTWSMSMGFMTSSLSLKKKTNLNRQKTSLGPSMKTRQR